LLSLLLIAMPLVVGQGPLEEALRATEAPNTLRAAFTVQLESAGARRVYRFDPRLKGAERWKLIDWAGEDDELESIGRTWAEEAAPDGRLFPDDLRVSLGQHLNVEEVNGTWRVNFQHAPSPNDTEFDVWAAERLQAAAWLDPIGERFLRLDYTLPKPTPGPEGGTITRYDQSYFLRTEPRWGLSYVSGFSVSLEGRAGFHKMQRQYSAQLVEAEFFFATEAAQLAFEESRQPEAAAPPPVRYALNDEVLPE
jgi:hypothetical protein